MALTDNPDWFLFKDQKRKLFQRQNWIPLRANVDYVKINRFGDNGYLRDSFACGTVAIPLKSRELGDRLGWSDIGLHETRHYADKDGYKPADSFRLDWSNPEIVGVSLILPQHFSLGEAPEWHVHTDLIIALGLRREGDVWIKPDENHAEVIRLRRDSDGSPNLVEIRTEFLRDYLKARDMGLRMTWYKDRDAILSQIDHIRWKDDPPQIDEPNYRFRSLIAELHEGSGMPFGGQTAVFRSGRTDVDPDDDVPEFGPETGENTYSETDTFGHPGAKVFRIEGEIWAEEWVEPAEHSPRVADDHPPSTTFFIVDASGTRESADVLDDEDVGKYLWFRPDVVNDILSRRGGELGWYTQKTGALQLTYGYHTHFGINDAGLLNAYAYDVAKLPEWQRQIWQGHNVAPDGGVCAELLAAQMEVRPAGTHAPEKHIPVALRDVDQLFSEVFGENLFREHRAKKDIIRTLHRFRAVQPSGLFELAKDITRTVIEDFDVKALHRISAPQKDQGKGSLKSLERVVAHKLTDLQSAADLLSFLHAIYELRGMTSHLPSSSDSDPYRSLGISRTAPPVEQGRQLLHALMYFLAELCRLLYAQTGDSSET